MLKKLKELFTGAGEKPPQDGFFLKVRCTKCQEEFNLFINYTASLAQNFDNGGYFLNKEIIGGKCINRIQVRMDFNQNRKLTSRTIENGEFID